MYKAASITRTSSQYQTTAVYFGLALTFILILGQRFDCDFAIYRFAQHLARGQSLDYGTPAALVSTFPLAPLLLADGLLTGIQVTLLADILLALALAGSGVFINCLIGSRWAGLVYVLLGAVMPSLVVAMMMAFGAAALVAGQHRRWILAGLLVALAILTSPMAIPLSLFMILLALREVGAVRHYLPPAVFIPCLVLLAIKLSLGGDVQYFSTDSPTLIIALALGAVVMLVLTRGKLPELTTAAAWLSTLALLVLLGGKPLQFAFGAPSSSDLKMGSWLKVNSENNESVATSRSGALSYYADRPIIDFGNKALSKEFFVSTAPDLIVLNKDQAVSWDGFATSYANVQVIDGMTAYHRVVNFAALDEHIVDKSFSQRLNRDDLRLIRAAFATHAHAGDLVRVRLDWQVAYTPSFDVTIKLALVDGQGKTVAAAVDTLPTMLWQVGKMSTYHLFRLPNDTANGDLNLNVAVMIRGGDLSNQSIGIISVTK